MSSAQEFKEASGAKMRGRQGGSSTLPHSCVTHCASLS